MKKPKKDKGSAKMRFSKFMLPLVLGSVMVAQQPASAKRMPHYTLQTRNVTVAQGKKFTVKSAVVKAAINNKRQANLNKVKVSGKVNTKKVGKYRLTVRFGNVKKTVYVYVKKSSAKRVVKKAAKHKLVKKTTKHKVVKRKLVKKTTKHKAVKKVVKAKAIKKTAKKAKVTYTLKAKNATLNFKQKFDVKQVISELKVNNKRQKNFKGVKVSGKVNSNKAGKYRLTLHFGNVKQNVVVTVKAAVVKPAAKKVVAKPVTTTTPATTTPAATTPVTPTQTPATNPNYQYTLSVHDMTIPLGGKSGIKGQAFTKYDPITNVSDDQGKTVATSEVAVSGDVNVHKAGTYQLTYTYHGITKTANVTVINEKMVNLLRGDTNTVNSGANASNAPAVGSANWGHYQSRDDFDSYTVTTSGASNGSYSLHGVFGPSIYNSSDAANVQSAVKVGNYWYILVNTEKNDDSSRLIKVDDAMFSTMDHKSDFHHFLWWAQNPDKPSSQYKRFAQYITMGPTFKIGHGQSMAYHNGKLWVTEQESGSKTNEGVIGIVSLDLDTLDVASQQRIPVTTDGISKNVNGLNMTFGANNTFYMTVVLNASPTVPNGGYQFWWGTIDDNGQLHFESKGQRINGQCGDFLQALTYNPANNRLYIVSDGSYMSLPADKLTNHTLTTSDFNITRVNTGDINHPLEAETLQFDGDKCYYFTNSFPLIHEGNWQDVAQ